MIQVEFAEGKIPHFLLFVVIFIQRHDLLVASFSMIRISCGHQVSRHPSFSCLSIIRASRQYHSSPLKDYYAILGVKKDSTQQEIRSQYVELCKIHHPDKARNDQEQNSNKIKFQEINEAYQNLIKASSRQEYDLRSANPSHGQHYNYPRWRW